MDGRFADFCQTSFNDIDNIVLLEELLNLTGTRCQFGDVCLCIINTNQNENRTCNDHEITINVAEILFRQYHLYSASIMDDPSDNLLTSKSLMIY